MPATEQFFRHLQFRDLVLRVHNLERVTAFYADILGLKVINHSLERVGFSPTGAAPALLVLEAAPRAPARQPQSAGLFHLALLYPDREALGRILAQLVDQRIRMGGADHGVSEAIYIDDPEGNGVELYVDRPAEAWPWAADESAVSMYTRPLDYEGILAAGRKYPGPVMHPETRIGHVHLCVADLAQAEGFFAGRLGFSVRQRDFPGALFLARDGYHHHIGVNTWQSSAPSAPGQLGLSSFTIACSDVTRATTETTADGITILLEPL